MVINGNEYHCIDFTDTLDSGAEFLAITILGEFKDKSNNLDIDYMGNHYHGYKLLPSKHKGVTDFMVYIYQPGDSELEVNYV